MIPKLPVGFFAAFAAAWLLTACGQSNEGGGSEPSGESPQPQSTSQQIYEVDSQPASENDKLLAEWDGGRIYQSQLKKILQSRIEELKRSTQNEADIDELVQEEKRQILEVLVDNYIMVQEAHKRGLSLTPLEKENLLKQVRGMYPSEDAYQAAMEQAGQSEEDLLRVMSAIELSKKSKRDQQEKIRQSIDEQDKKAFYKENIDFFTPPQRTSFNRVTIYFGDQRSEEEAKALADKLHREVREQLQAIEEDAIPNSPTSEEVFKKKRKVLQDYAKRYSESPEKDYNYGYVNIYHSDGFKSAYSEAFLNEAKQLERGELSGVIRNVNQDNGRSSYQFFLVVDQVRAKTHPFDSEAVKNMLPNMMLQEKMKEWKHELRDKYKVKFYQNHLDEMTPAAQ